MDRESRHCEITTADARWLRECVGAFEQNGDFKPLLETVEAQPELVARAIVLALEVEQIRRERDDAKHNLVEASRLWEGPETDDWLQGVRKEAAHQTARWGVEGEDGKDWTDFFWLVGYLTGKALRSSLEGDQEKARHHTISTGAVLLNWHACLVGIAHRFRPGIAAPESET